MELLINEALWRSGLSESPGVFDALRRWINSTGDRLQIIKWFDDGRSDHPVALVLRTGSINGQLVMKFCDPGVRTAAFNQAWKSSRGYREDHLAEKVDGPISMDRWDAVFFRIAGDDLDEFLPLSAHSASESLPACLRTIVTSVISDWNPDFSLPDNPAIGELLRPIVDHRLAAARDWAYGRGLAVDATSPFAFVWGEDARRDLIGPLVGKAHGDLSARNIFVPGLREPRAAGYVLIDYDHFGTERLLAFDPMHLVVALALDDFAEAGPKTRADWIKAMVDPTVPDLQRGAHPMRDVCRAVWEGVLAAYPGAALPDLWRSQLLVGLVGAGLLHVGRKLPMEASDEARQWCYELATTAADALRRRLPAAASKRVEAASPTRSGHRKKIGRRTIDRETEQAALRTRLTSGPFGAVVVHGLAGVGKSQVLDSVLDGLDADSVSPARVHRQVVDAATRLDLKTFIDALEGRDTPSTRPGQASLARLEAVLDGLGGRHVTLALDGAENLLVRGSDELADLDLDEALELLTTTGHSHHVSVVLAFRDIPTSPTGGLWPRLTGPIAIPQLEFEKFFEFVEEIDRDRILRVNRLDPEFRRKLHRHLQGNPRNAEIVVALVTFTEDTMSLPELAERLFLWPPAQVSTKLVQLLAERLGPLRGTVLDLLAAFGTPISARTVAVAAGPAAGDVAHQLTVLAGKRVIYQNDDEDYYLPEPSATVVLDRLDDERRRTHMEAVARALGGIADGPVLGVRDLRIRFAELKALIEARRFSDAYRVIEHLCRNYLYHWNCGHLLTEQRIDVRFQLDDDHLEMANENALAEIYTATGNHRLASDAFGLALEKADELGDEPSRQIIQLNMANWYLDIGDTNRARCYYELVRDDPERVGNLAVRMGALEGLADCDRRHGRYNDAIVNARKALSLSRTDFSADPTAAAYAAEGRILTLMKLSRWHAEIGDHPEAKSFMRQADEAAGGASAELLRAARLDGWADLRLAQDDVPGSITAAEEAVALARATSDEVVLLQAHTTLCVAHLREGEIDRAHREIQLAQLHRKRDRRGRSLLIIALQSLFILRAGDVSDAARLFRRLAGESERRAADPLDFAAHDMCGFAICGLAVTEDANVTDAEELFRETRRQVPGTPVLVSRLRFLVEKLDEWGGKPGLLAPAIEALRSNGWATGERTG